MVHHYPGRAFDLDANSLRGIAAPLRSLRARGPHGLVRRLDLVASSCIWGMLKCGSRSMAGSDRQQRFKEYAERDRLGTKNPCWFRQMAFVQSHCSKFQPDPMFADWLKLRLRSSGQY